MAADGGLGEEQIVSRLREAFQFGYPAKCFQMPKIDFQWQFFHYGQNIKSLF
jgi:hypothetical protein